MPNNELKTYALNLLVTMFKPMCIRYKNDLNFISLVRSAIYLRNMIINDSILLFIDFAEITLDNKGLLYLLTKAAEIISIHSLPSKEPVVS